MTYKIYNFPIVGESALTPTKPGTTWSSPIQSSLSGWSHCHICKLWNEPNGGRGIIAETRGTKEFQRSARKSPTFYPSTSPSFITTGNMDGIPTSIWLKDESTHHPFTELTSTLLNVRLRTRQWSYEGSLHGAALRFRFSTLPFIVDLSFKSWY